MFKRTFIFVLMIFCLLFEQFVCARIKFTNIVCIENDSAFAKFERCKLKAVSRNVNYFTLKAVLLQVPVTDMNIRFQVMKRANGWKPWLYDFSVKCNFTRHLNPLTGLLWSIVKGATNIQHDCPYNQTLEIERLDNGFIENSLKRLPIPNGEYALFTTWQAYNVTRATINYYLTIF